MNGSECTNSRYFGGGGGLNYSSLTGIVPARHSEAHLRSTRFVPENLKRYTSRRLRHTADGHSMTERAFTLAEVLITLVIIGIVAAMTIPMLIQKHKEKVAVTKLKKFYSVISQAYQMAELDYGDPANWDLIAANSIPGAKNLGEKFEPYLKIIAKDTGTGSRAVYSLPDNMWFQVFVSSPDCSYSTGSGPFSHVCAAMDVKINHAATVVGENRFQFVITQSGVFPAGSRSRPVCHSASACGRPEHTTVMLALHGFCSMKTWTTCTATTCHGVVKQLAGKTRL